MKPQELRHSTQDKQPTKRPNYALRRFGAGALVTLAGLGVWKGVELASDAASALSDKETGCVTTQVYAGDNNSDPIARAIDELQETNPDFAPRTSRELNRVAERLGTIHPGEQIEVCGIEDPILGDTVFVERVTSEKE
ncbi:hypothetical protein B7Y92_02720 [Candidatus Saccharibacteria bacterium 32-50-13]|nr:MAG: hypothetical protein B7Y92_02720 [Candidatus Saccharibacteria bacterium 32-50-13]